MKTMYRATSRDYGYIKKGYDPVRNDSKNSKKKESSAARNRQAYEGKAALLLTWELAKIDDPDYRRQLAHRVASKKNQLKVRGLEV